MHRARFAAAVLLLLSMRASLLFAQGSTQVPAGGTLQITARLVLLDVTVKDAKGHPVDGLTAKDFAVYEDRTPETIVSFEATNRHTLPASTDRATIFDPGKPQPFGSAPVTMLVLDQVNTHFADSVYGIDQLMRYLARQPATLDEPTTLLVVRDHGFQELAPYTLDRDALMAALKKHPAEQAWQLEQSMSVGQGVAERLDRSLAALEQLAQNSVRIPGHKNLIWIGAGFPSIDPTSLTEGTEIELKNLLQHATDTLLNDRVSLYAIDPTTTAASFTEITDPDQLEFAQAAAEGAGRNLDPFDKTLGFDTLGPVTGGRIIRQRNDVDMQIGQSIATGSTYYTLGYRPSADFNATAGFRHIRVVCLRPGLTASTHDGYYAAGAATTQTRDTVAYDLNNAATASIPLHAVAFTVTPAAGPAAWTLHVQSADLSWTAGAAGQSASAQVLCVALGANGKILGHTLHTETGQAGASVDTRSPEQMVAFSTSLAVPAKAVRLRFIVRDQGSGRMGSVDLPVK